MTTVDRPTARDLHAAGLRQEAERLEALAALSDALRQPWRARLRRAQARTRREALARVEAGGTGRGERA